MPRLAELPPGTSAFIDANIFLDHFLRRRSASTVFLTRVWEREVAGVTSVSVLAEVRHGLLRAEASARFKLSSRATLRYLRAHPAIISTLRQTHLLLAELKGWPIRQVHVTRGQFWQACRLSDRYGLLTNDALHLATLRAHGLRHLVSADRDFRRVPRLTLWTP